MKIKAMLQNLKVHHVPISESVLRDQGFDEQVIKIWRTMHSKDKQDRDRMISVLDDIAAGRDAAGDESARLAADAAADAVRDAPTEAAALAVYISFVLGLAGAEVTR